MMAAKKPTDDRIETVRKSMSALKLALHEIEQAHPELQSNRPMPSVSTTIDFILGGPAAVSKLLGVTIQAVMKYKDSEKFPPSSWLVLSPRIEAKGYRPDPKKFGMRTPKRAPRRTP